MSTATTPRNSPETTNPAVLPEAARGRERALLVHLRGVARADQDDLDEFQFLAESAGVAVCAVITGRGDRPDAATYIGKGKAEELRAAVLEHRADVVLVNHTLSPVQERNLEKIVSCRVLDRTGLILDIFAQRARSHEGKLQVELAQLEHLATRLVRGWTHLERQKGGIGLRGPGETQLETDRRLLRERVKHLNRRLEKLRTQRQSRRKARNKIPIPTVSLVGYTNAGKSTLFNRLSGAVAYTADQLFATLDPTARRVHLPGNIDIVLADTVGFIRHLPHGLVEAFKSTLEEVAEADLLLHVVDAASDERRDQIEQVNRVLAEIGAQHVPQLVIFNKLDLVGEPARLERDSDGLITKVWLSAKSGAGLELLQQALSEHYRRHRLHRQLCLPPRAGRLRARIYEHLQVLRERNLESGEWLLDIELAPADLAWLAQQDGFNSSFFVLEPAAVVLAPTGS